MTDDLDTHGTSIMHPADGDTDTRTADNTRTDTSFQLSEIDEHPGDGRTTHSRLDHGSATAFAGVYPALVTPFDEDGDVDHDRLRAHARQLESAGVDGVVPAGSTGEAATLSHDEHVAVVETVADAVDIPVVGGAGSNSTREACSLTRRVAAAGADAVLSIAPYYNRPEPVGFREHFRSVADEAATADVPVILYNVPSRTGRSLTPETVGALADHEAVLGYKAASGDLELVSAVLERTRDARFDVLSGDDALTLPMVSMGATGVVSVGANIAPERTTATVHAALSGEFDLARERHHELGSLFRVLFAETNPVPVKEAVALRDGTDPRLRSPLSRATPATREQVRAVLTELDLWSDDGPTEQTSMLPSGRTEGSR